MQRAESETREDWTTLVAVNAGRSNSQQSVRKLDIRRRNQFD